MPDPATLALFSVAALALIVIPGPAVLYIVTQSVHRGRSAGVVSAAGIANGALVHVAAAAVGLSALLMRSAPAFEVVKIAGAAYLVYLGLRRLLGRDGLAAAHASPPRPLRHVYAQGVVVNVLNPKTALFFLAFLPQFATTWQGILVLGLLFGALGFVTDGGYALLAGTFGDRLRARQRLQRYVSGVVFIALGAFAAVTSPPRTN